ncbi:lipopolysaccharide biosynthesis protein [Arthrobacter subterraneus]|nr:oligosaccharide flippase family protein [Arthrobacter subterraneus]
MASSSERSALIGSGSVYALASAAPVLSTLFITPLVTRVFSPENYGLIAMTITLYQVGGVLLGFGMSAAITRHALISNSGRPGAAALVITNSVFSFFLAAVAALIVVLSGYEVIPTYTPALFVGACISSAAFASLTGCLALLRADQAVKKFVMFSVVASLGGPLTGLSAVLLVSSSPVTYVFALAVVQTLVAAVAILECLRKGSVVWCLSDQIAAIKFGLPTLPHQIAPSAMVTSLVLIVAVMRGPVPAGQLQIGLLLANGIVVILGALNNAWAPLIYKAEPSERIGLLSRTSWVVSGAIVFLAAIFSASVGVLAPLIAGALAGDDVVHRIAVIGASGGILAVYYLANIHLVFLTGNTTMLALTTPLAALFATGTVVWLTTSLMLPLECIALVLPLYNCLQILSASILRRATGLGAPSLSPLIPNSLFSGAFLVSALLFTVDSWTLWISIGVIALSAGFYNRAILRNTELERHG